MFTINRASEGGLVLSGRFHAAHLDDVREVLSSLTESCTLDCHDLTYISSAGLGLLIDTQRRLKDGGHELKLANLNEHMRDLFRVAGLDMIFNLQE